MKFVGLSKTMFNSSACMMKENNEAEVFLTERLTRKKASGAWPRVAISAMLKSLNFIEDSEKILMSENRDVDDSLLIEEMLNQKIPFIEELEKENLGAFTRLKNPQLQFLTHHRAHAYSAAFMSPFTKALVLVIDGAGSRKRLFSAEHPEFSLTNFKTVPDDAAEERTLYELNNGQLNCLDKKWQVFKPSQKVQGHSFSEGLGSFYEKVAEYIFNSKRAAGKVMGLAAFGRGFEITNPIDFLESLDWGQSFQGSKKEDWEAASKAKIEFAPIHRQEALVQNLTFKDIAACTQNYFEKELINYIREFKSRFNKYENLILVGGCALNCTTNMKLVEAQIFKNIYVPPFPSDEGISIGLAFSQSQQNGATWIAKKPTEQISYFGPRSSIPSNSEIPSIFANFEIVKPDSMTEFCSELLEAGHVIAWFQGRSECGPRSLGNRSILMRPDLKGAKNFLNSNIKFREAFRPYGCSVPYEKAHEYFIIEEGFENPFMSFAVKTRPEFRESLGEVTHVDGTSRMQTVRLEQNPQFYDLLKKFGARTNLFCLLNTSLNVMGEPIVETPLDARNFLNKVPVHGLAIGDYYIRKGIK